MQVGRRKIGRARDFSGNMPEGSVNGNVDRSEASSRGCEGPPAPMNHREKRDTRKVASQAAAALRIFLRRYGRSADRP